MATFTDLPQEDQDALLEYIEDVASWGMADTEETLAPGFDQTRQHLNVLVEALRDTNLVERPAVRRLARAAAAHERAAAKMLSAGRELDRCVDTLTNAAAEADQELRRLQQP